MTGKADFTEEESFPVELVDDRRFTLSLAERAG
jgi:hypothetical protein